MGNCPERTVVACALLDLSALQHVEGKIAHDTIEIGKALFGRPYTCARRSEPQIGILNDILGSFPPAKNRCRIVDQGGTVREIPCLASPSFMSRLFTRRREALAAG